MPRGDGTGPWGTRPVGRGRCLGFGRGMRRGLERGFGSAGNTVTTPEILEEQAVRLEEQAARLRNLAKQSRKAE